MLTDNTSLLTKDTDKILMAMVSSSRPEAALFRLYDEASDKDSFITALIGVLILRHKQWQLNDRRGVAPGGKEK